MFTSDIIHCFGDIKKNAARKEDKVMSVNTGKTKCSFC